GAAPPGAMGGAASRPLHRRDPSPRFLRRDDRIVGPVERAGQDGPQPVGPRRVAPIPDRRDRCEPPRMGRRGGRGPSPRGGVSPPPPPPPPPAPRPPPP